MKGFLLGLVAGAVIGAGGFWGYFITRGTIQEFAQIRCHSVFVGAKIFGQDPVERAADLVGSDKATRAVDLCRLILE